MTNYKFAFVLGLEEDSRDYLRKCDLDVYPFLTEIENIKFQFADENEKTISSIVYVEEDVNRKFTDQVETALKSNQIEVEVVSKAKWHPFDKLN